MRGTALAAALLSALVARVAASAAVPERICDPGDVAPRARCESPDYEALEFSRENGDRFHQCCERYGAYLARIEHVSIEELENTIRQW